MAPPAAARPLLSDIGLAEAWRRLTVHFAGVVWRARTERVPYGKVLLSTWAAFVAWVVGRRLGLLRGRRRARAVAAAPARRQQSGRAPGGAQPRRRNDLREVLRTVVPYMFTKHGAYFAAYILSLCSRILITVKLADYGGLLGALMGARQFEDMFRGQARFGLWCMAAALATAAMKFLEKRVTVSLRSILYRHYLTRYLDERRLAYYHVAGAVEDPASRVTEDLEQFATVAVRTLGHMLKPLIDVAHLCAVIGSRIGLASLLIFISFFGASQQMVQQVKGSLPIGMKELAVMKQEKEASLRAHHQRLHDFREQIALQRGTPTEQRELLRKYRSLEKHGVLTAIAYSVIDVFTTYIMKYGGAMCGFSVLIPGVYFGDPKRSRTQVTTEYLANSTLLGTLATAVKDFVDAAQELPRVSGLAMRVNELARAVAELPPAPRPERGAAADGISVRGLSVAPPGQHADRLVARASFDVAEGQHLVIRGANGCGKTSLLRTLCGLWAPPEAAEQHRMPPEDAVFAVPQDAYFPVGTLIEQITYPTAGAEAGLTAERAAALLREVGLAELAERDGGVGAENDWRAVLSGGQKQKLSWARMLFHCPRFALIDEGTSAVSTVDGSVDALHESAKQRGITLVSVSHHSAVDRHHTNALTLSAGGAWQFGRV